MEVFNGQENTSCRCFIISVINGIPVFFSETPSRTPGESVQNTGETTGKTETTPQEITGDRSTDATPVIDHRKSLVKKDEGKGVGKDIIVESPMYTAIVSSKGAGLKSFKLKNYRKTMDKESPLVELVDVGGSTDCPLTTTFPESSIDIPVDVIYESNLDSIDFTHAVNAKDLVFSWSYPGEIKVDKIYTFYPDKYYFDLEVKLTNLSDDTIRENALIEWNRYVDPSEKTSRYSHEGPTSYVKNKIVSEKIKKMGDKKVQRTGCIMGRIRNKIFHSGHDTGTTIPHQLCRFQRFKIWLSRPSRDPKYYTSRPIGIIQVCFICRSKGV